ncbi:MAG: hypothetical protein RLY20_1565 [Verrucomicrobiota bacterium]
MLKPLKDADAHTETCLRSWLTQDFGGPVQVLFGVADANDAACGVVKKLLAEFPQADAQLVICPEPLGTNAKVSTLIKLERFAKHELICVSDADVRVPEDFLTEAVRPLSSGAPAPGPAASDHAGSEAGAPAALVNCFYRMANPTSPAMQCEAVAINADFWSQVLQSCSLKPMAFALGAVMLTRRTELAGIGGFTAIKDCLADDYQLGNRIAKRGGRIEICPVVVECWDAPMGWAAVWRHQLRWARTVRVCQPAPYFFSILGNPTFWPALWVATTFEPLALAFLGAMLAARLVVTADLQRRLANSGKNPTTDFWLAPVKDLMQVAVWAGAFAGSTIEWRGRRMKLRPDGTLSNV